MIEIHHADNLEVLPDFEDGSFDFIYIDPPFNTGQKRRHTRLRTRKSSNGEGDRIGFKGERYVTEKLGTRTYADTYDDYLAFIGPRLEHAHRLLAPHGSLFVHLDYREVHYVKVLLDQLFGRDCFVNEIIWAYDYGARTKKRWAPKHDNILWYAREPKGYVYQHECADRIPYMAPGLVGKEKAARGKTPTDCWWHTIVSPTSKERTGYPTQKPVAILERLIKVHTRPGDRVLDFFAGSGTTGEAARRHDRDAVLIDHNPEAIEVMLERFADANPRVHGWDRVDPEAPPPENEQSPTRSTAK